MSDNGRIPFVDLAAQHDPIRRELDEAMRRVWETGDFILGEELRLFEAEFAAYIGVAHAVGAGSGTAALSIALASAGVGPGDEVIVPAHTYIATALAVLHAGAQPVLCDVDGATGLIDLDSAAEVAGERVAAVVPVHLYGQACDMDEVERFAAARGIAVIEDAAQAHGATWNDARAGSFGRASAFSFYPSKNLGAFGDGGIVCTDDPEVADRARRLRNLGQLGRADHEILGHNERLDTLQAAVLRVKLGRLEEWNAERRSIAANYRAELSGTVTCLPERPGATDVYHLFAVRVPDRGGVSDALEARGIASGIHYPRALHEQPSLRGLLGERTGLDAAEGWAREELSLPIYPGMRGADAARVSACVLGAAPGEEMPS